MNDSFLERIETLLHEGKITQEEADKLRAAIASEEKESQKVVPAASSFGTSSLVQEPIEKPEKKIKITADFDIKAGLDSGKTQTATTEIPLKRLMINVSAGDVDVKGIEGLQEVRLINAKSNVEMKSEGDTIWITGHDRMDNQKEKGWFDFLIKTIGRFSPVKIRLEVPTDLELVVVKAMAGDVDVDGVNGRVELDLKAGDLSLSGASSFEIKSMAGDIDVATKLLSGQSSIKSMAGDVDVALSSDSDVTIKASVSAGDIKIRDFGTTKEHRKFASEQVEAVIGQGNAQLEINLSAGDIEIKARK